MNTEFKCGICGDEYTKEPFGGYCDTTFECAGEDLIMVTN